MIYGGPLILVKLQTEREGLLVSSIANSIECRQQLHSYNYMPHMYIRPHLEYLI